MKLKQAGDPREIEVEIAARDGATVRARIDGREVSAEIEPLADGAVMMQLDGRRIRVAGGRIRNSILIAAGAASFEFVPIEGRAGTARHGLAAPEVTAPMPGKILKLLVAAGDKVEHGQALAVLEAMKMETTLYAESAAVVKRIRVEAGDMVDHGAVIIEFSAAPGDPSTSGPPAPDA